MGSSRLRASLRLAVLTSVVFGLQASTAHAQLLPWFRSRPPCATSPCAPSADMSTPPIDTTTPPRVDMNAVPAEAPQPGPVTAAAFAPNMIGDLLGAGNSLSFFYQRARGPQASAGGAIPAVVIDGTGNTNINNPSVAENNTAIPQDRLSFRFNYFNRSLSVTGDSGQTVNLGTVPTFVNGTVQNVPISKSIVTTKSYDVYDYTFSFEKTFADGLFSLEMRLPFATTLSHNQNFSVANIVGFGTDTNGDTNEKQLITSPTPGRTFGVTGDEIGNMTIILKGLLYNTPTFAFAGGLACNVPTARGTNTTVVDFLGDIRDFDSQGQRIRTFNVANETWSLSPFVAFLAKPTERLFFQGFLQYDQPLNSSRISYTQIVDPNAEPTHVPGTPISVTDQIREQSLLHLDLGVGGWLLRDPQRAWLTGIAPTVEIHYTTTTSNADIRTLPVNTFFRAPDGTVALEPNPTVGNLRNRLDIVDLTLGTTFLIKDRATIAAGVTLPLRNGDNRTFDYELQLQLNYYFGGPGRNQADRTPNLQ